MPTTSFKLTYNGQTRRVVYNELPAWDQLANKLHALYNIPLTKVGVSYIDSDDDEITASSNEELQDFYRTTYHDGQPVKFKVLDLTAPRDTISRDLDFQESEWHPFNIEEYVDTISEGPHAFVEIVDSDVSGFAKEAKESSETESEAAQSTVRPSYIDKGKRKASTTSLSAASITSVINEDFSPKYPIHVADHNSVKPPGEPIMERPKTPTVEQSTPKPQSPQYILEENPDNPPPASAPQTNEAEDPPLPDLESIPPPNGPANLSHDIASFLDVLTSVLSSHPELLDGARNIIRNATSGAYWQAHRTSLSQAVAELQQSTQDIEGQAATRVSDALNNIFRSLSVAEGTNTESSQPASQNTAQQGSNEQSTTNAQSTNNAPPRYPQPFPWPQFAQGRPWTRRSTGGLDMFNSFMRGPWEAGVNRPPLPPPVVPPMYGLQFNHPPPPPPPLFPSMYHPATFPPPPPPQPHVPPVPSGDNASPLPDSSATPQQPTTTNPPAKSTEPAQQNSNVNFFSQTSDQGELSREQQELRARVEEAKRLYKAEKEAYRKEREQRKRDREGRKVRDLNNIIPVPDFERATQFDAPNFTTETTSSQTPHIVSQASGRFPQFELYGVPRRHNTHLGHGLPSRRSERKPEDLATRAQSRIARRLSDMGFSENSHPTLPEKIKKQMPTNRVLSKEEEDDVVTNLLEELLAETAKTPFASTSSARQKDVSGGWNL